MCVFEGGVDNSLYVCVCVRARESVNDCERNREEKIIRRKHVVEGLTYSEQMG